MIVDKEEGFQVSRGEDLPQKGFHLGDQSGEAPAVFQGGGHVLGGILRGTVVLQFLGGRGLHRLGGVGQLHDHQSLMGLFQAVSLPVEGGSVFPGQKAQVEEGGISVVCRQEPVRRFPVEG